MKKLNNQLLLRNYNETDYSKVEYMLGQLSRVTTRTKKDIVETHEKLEYYGPDIRLVGTINGEVVCYGVGILDLKVRGGLCMHIEDIVVDHEMQRQGIGLILIKQLIDEAKKAGCYKVQLTTTILNIDFYTKCGLVLDGGVQFTKLLV